VILSFRIGEFRLLWSRTSAFAVMKLVTATNRYSVVCEPTDTVVNTRFIRWISTTRL